MLSEDEYAGLAERELCALIDALDRLGADGFEAELASDILTLEFTDGTKYVLNSHRAARQIWMAAERSAWHFAWGGESARWTAERNADELWSTLSAALARKLGRPVELTRPAMSPFA